MEWRGRTRALTRNIVKFGPDWINKFKYFADGWRMGMRAFCFSKIFNYYINKWWPCFHNLIICCIWVLWYHFVYFTVLHDYAGWHCNRFLLTQHPDGRPTRIWRNCLQGLIDFAAYRFAASISGRYRWWWHARRWRRANLFSEIP